MSLTGRHRGYAPPVTDRPIIQSEQYKQIQLEAQETAENLLLFSADIGKEMQKIEKASGNQYMLSDDNGKKHKSDTIHEMGFTDRQARDFQTLTTRS